MSGKGIVAGIIIFIVAFLIGWCVIGGESISDIPVVGDLLPSSNNNHNNNDYKIVTNNNNNNQNNKSQGSSNYVISADASMAKNISAAIQPSNSYVRSLALSLISSKHGGAYTIEQICDIYTGLNRRWTYVNDPNGSEYFAPAGESARLLKGDCDDFAILMASCIEAIGGSARVIAAQSKSKGGHAYAEVSLASNEKDKTKLAQAIANIYQDTVYTHEDYSTGRYWLNLDWSANHPGGKFFPNSGSVLVVYSNGYYERQNFTPTYTY